MEMVRAIVFDYGGVLMDWDPRYLYRNILGDQTAAENFLTEIEFADWNHEQDKGRTWADGVAVPFRQYPQHAELIQAYDDRWMETLRGDIPGTVEIFRALKTRGLSAVRVEQLVGGKVCAGAGRVPVL